jgi:Na+-transporting NADH:ubiquinone oxidoreductase subunit NqrC
MKILQIVLVTVLLIGTTLLSAHPASSMKADFDKDTNILMVSFEHQVKNPADHFIYELAVKLNKKEIITQLVSKQETDKGGEYQYKIIDAKVGDTITVTAACNKSGKKSASLEIE